MNALAPDTDGAAGCCCRPFSLVAVTTVVTVAEILKSSRYVDIVRTLACFGLHRFSAWWAQHRASVEAGLWAPLPACGLAAPAACGALVAPAM